MSTTFAGTQFRDDVTKRVLRGAEFQEDVTKLSAEAVTHREHGQHFSFQSAEFQEDVTKLSAEEITRQLDQIRKAEALQISVTQLAHGCNVKTPRHQRIEMCGLFRRKHLVLPAIAQGRDFTKLLFESGLTGDALNALVISSTTAAQVDIHGRARKHSKVAHTAD
eukprot:1161315-Pelagomonas_calceolata.AAC.2